MRGGESRELGRRERVQQRVGVPVAGSQQSPHAGGLGGQHPQGAAHPDPGADPQQPGAARRRRDARAHRHVDPGLPQLLHPGQQGVRGEQHLGGDIGGVLRLPPQQLERRRGVGMRMPLGMRADADHEPAPGRGDRLEQRERPVVGAGGRGRIPRDDEQLLDARAAEPLQDPLERVRPLDHPSGEVRDRDHAPGGERRRRLERRLEPLGGGGGDRHPRPGGQVLERALGDAGQRDHLELRLPRRRARGRGAPGARRRGRACPVSHRRRPPRRALRHRPSAAPSPGR